MQRRAVVGTQSFAAMYYLWPHRDEKIASQWFRLPSVHTVFIFIGLFLVSGCSRSPQMPQANSGTDWHEFQGTWSATGSRNVIRLEGDRRASIANFNGSLMLSGASRPNVGFRADAIVFNDSSTGLIGRAVWTDEHGDQAFSELHGSGATTDNKIVGSFVGGTGRYAGARGTYEFSWRFVLESEDGNLQGESVGLKGRVRVGSSSASSSLGDPRS
ncbi:MAG TPA: hypothetical protein VG498_08055 [Terriglobales bacterium]|nr:hypothetical protein [Terriglobales bacterium]